MLWLSSWVLMDKIFFRFFTSCPRLYFLCAAYYFILLKFCIYTIILLFYLLSSLFSAISNWMRSSKTFTYFFWPIRWARSCACKSIWGFQSESNMMTVSAVCKFKPSPPALVLSRNTSYTEFYELNLSVISPLYLVAPSNLRCFTPL